MEYYSRSLTTSAPPTLLQKRNAQYIKFSLLQSKLNRNVFPNDFSPNGSWLQATTCCKSPIIIPAATLRTGRELKPFIAIVFARFSVEMGECIRHSDQHLKLGIRLPIDLRNTSRDIPRADPVGIVEAALSPA